MRRSLAALAAACAIVIAGCGGSTHHRAVPPRVPSPVVSLASCPQADRGHGYMGECAPKAQALAVAPRTVEQGPVYVDRSNNDPCFCGAQIKAAGQLGLIVKANQGVGFVDSTEVGMVASARAAGLAVGAYDFDQDYTIAEVQLFVARMHAAGIYPSTPNTFPATLDVEFGAFSYTGLLAQIHYLQAQGYRVQIYTGDWYWGKHAGCQWPAGIPGWISGYPNAIVPCGLQQRLGLYLSHQFTSTPVDLSVFRGSSAQFQAFVNAKPPAPRLICWGPHAQLHNATCRKVRGEVGRWSRARNATRRALGRVEYGLVAPYGTHSLPCSRPYRRGRCVRYGRLYTQLAQRESWFAQKVTATMRAYL